MAVENLRNYANGKPEQSESRETTGETFSFAPFFVRPGGEWKQKYWFCTPLPQVIQNRFQSPPLWWWTGLLFWRWSLTVKLTGAVFTFTVGGVTFTVGDETFTVGDEAYIGTQRTVPVSFVTDCKSYVTNCKSENSACKFYSWWPLPEWQSG